MDKRRRPVAFEGTGGVSAPDAACVSVRFGSLSIEVATDAGRAEPVSARKTMQPLRVVKTSQPAAEPVAEPYATVCPSRLCWHCCESLDGLDARRLATAYDPAQRAFRFEGYFCSWECARAYSFALSDHEGITRRACVFTLLYAALYDEAPPHIAPAPPRSALRPFGGSLEPETYRASFDVAANARPFSLRLQRAGAGEWHTVA
jgi:hypothetical protein